jgi:hypothetical protein
MSSLTTLVVNGTAFVWTRFGASGPVWLSGMPQRNAKENRRGMFYG